MENKQMKCIKGESCLHCGSNYCRFVDELDQLKAEKEILKEKLVISSNSDKKTLKIIQTLTDIKEMLKEICMEECSFDWNKTSKKHCGDYDCRYGQIIQKIREVEDEHNG